MMNGDEVRSVCENRAREAGVSLFTPDELRKSAATQIGLAKAASRKAKRQKSASSDDLYDASESANEVAGSRSMATVCFPVWEVSIKS